MNPIISVLMSAYNGEKHLRRAIESILSQTFTDFEFIIINDGSTDSTVEIIESYNDSRIKLVHNKNNIGLTESLNKGINLAQGKYIARMDADDISLPERFETQLKYFEADTSLAFCASRVRVIDENENIIGRIKPFASDKMMNWHLLSWHLLFGNKKIYHSSVLVKKEVLVKLNGYARWARYCQDFELWSRMCLTYKMVIVPEVLIHWRHTEAGISNKYFHEQRQTEYKIYQNVHQCLTNSLIHKDHSLYLARLVKKLNYDIKPFTLDILRLLDEIKLSFITHYEPDLDTRKEIETTVQDAYRKLFRKTIHTFSFHSLRIVLNIFLNRPNIILEEAITIVNHKLNGRISNLFHGMVPKYKK